MDQVTARGRVGDPDEIADAVLFLVEDRSSHVNGTVDERVVPEHSTAADTVRRTLTDNVFVLLFGVSRTTGSRRPT